MLLRRQADRLLADLPGKPVISDFGIALTVSVGGGKRLTETGLSLGTPHYMSPEQATGDQTVGPPSDVEVGNALSALFKRRRINLEQARGALSSYGDIAVRMADVDVEACVQLAHEQSIYAYDAYFLECARRYRTPLLSLDDPQRRLAMQLDIDVMEVAG